MAAPFQWTDARDRQLRDLAAKGTSVRGIAAELGTTKSTVDRRIQRLGIVLDRSSTEAATRANATDAKARRARLLVSVYDELEALAEDLKRARTEHQWKTILKGEGGVEHTRTLDFVPIRDRRDAADTISRLHVVAHRIETQDHGGAQHVVGLLQQTAAALGLTDGQDAGDA